jgi:PncC family amidohydrolase
MQDLHNEIQKLADKIIRSMDHKRQTIGTAESVTGGGLAFYLTAIPGSSKVVKGGIVAYGDAIKIGLLGVNRETIDNCGVVSMEVAVEMARGIRIRTASHFGLGVTGFAGPEGGDDFAPLGRVFWGLACPDGYFSLQLDLTGDRMTIRMESIKRGMEFLQEYL